MACIIQSAEVESAVRRVLSRQRYHLSAPRGNGETGVDVLASRGSEVWHIEIIGYKAAPPQKSSDFYASFFRAVSRLKDGARHIAIAVPAAGFEHGMRARPAHYGEGWRRIGIAFPELEIWMVECDPPSVRRSAWASWLAK